MRLTTVYVHQFLHYMGVLVLDLLQSFVSLIRTSLLHLGFGRLEGLVVGHVTFRVRHLLHVKLIFSELPVVVEGIVAHHFYKVIK